MREILRSDKLPGQTSQPAALIALMAEWLLRFPCFEDARRIPRSPEELLGLVTQAYEDDDLTEEQELLWETILHVAGFTTDIDFARVVRTLADDDYAILEGLLRETRVDVTKG